MRDQDSVAVLRERLAEEYQHAGKGYAEVERRIEAYEFAIRAIQSQQDGAQGGDPVAYDRDLITDMLSEKCYDDGYGMKSHGCYTVEAIKEQMDLLRAADARDAAGVHTASRPAIAPQATPAAVDDAMARIGELIRTQDNRITDAPIFIVQQKRRICGMDEDYAEGFMWYDARAVESYDEAGKNERDAEREADGSQPIQWQRGGYIDTWDFVTACFTEQGCKDYLAQNGHNLREPRIYAEGSYRNAEFRAVRAYLAALAAPPAEVKP